MSPISVNSLFGVHLVLATSEAVMLQQPFERLSCLLNLELYHLTPQPLLQVHKLDTGSASLKNRLSRSGAPPKSTYLSTARGQALTDVATASHPH